jgi:hypothetical protein
MRYLLLAAALALPLAVRASDATDIKVTDLGGGNYRLTLTSTTIQDPDRGQDAMLLTAMKTCGTERPHFGHYKFQSQQKIGKDGTVSPGQPFVMDQNIACGGAAAVVPPPGNPEGNWTPSQAETDKMLATTHKFFDAQDRGDYPATYALLKPSTKDTVSLKDWTELSKKLGGQSGPLVDRKFVKFTWSKDPAGAPVPGIYAVVDYVSHFQSVDIECGYLAWYEESDGSFLLVHQQSGFIGKEQEKQMTPQAIATTKTQLGCLAD